MNFQDNVTGGFIDISTRYPGLTSYMLAFEESKVYHKLERGVLMEELFSFGDNTYINKSDMETHILVTLQLQLLFSSISKLSVHFKCWQSNG